MTPPLGKRVPLVDQSEAGDCGAASLAMVLAYYGCEVPLADVKAACSVTRDGSNAAEILVAARSFGLIAEGVTLDTEHLDLLPLPAILHWSFNHFVVLEAHTRVGATIVDPAFGRRQVGAAEIDAEFTGVAILVERGTLQPRRSQFELGRKIAPLIRTHRFDLLLAMAASLLLQAALLLIVVGTQRLIDSSPLLRAAPVEWVFLLLGVVTLRPLLRAFRTHSIHRLQSRLLERLMRRSVSHLLSLPLPFFLRRRSADLAERLQLGTLVRAGLNATTLGAGIDAGLLLFYAGTVFLYSRSLGVVVLSSVLLRVAISWSTQQRLQEQVISAVMASGREIGGLVEGLTGFESLCASGGTSRIVRRWTNEATRRLNAEYSSNRVVMRGEICLLLADTLTAVTILVVGWIGVREGPLTVGALIALVAVQQQIAAPVGALVSMFWQLPTVTGHVKRLSEIVDTTPEAVGALRWHGSGNIRLRDVSFSFGAGSGFSLKDINVSVRAGEWLGIVGASGSGKSTLAKLMVGLLPPSEGSVAWDDKDLRAADLRRMRRQVGVVFQEPLLLNDTVRANLSFGRGTFADKALWDALEAAQLRARVEEMPRGLDSHIRDNANNLSGGERQRLSLARALVANPIILLLDEAMSSLDRETETAIRHALRRSNRTIIVVAHSLETIEHCDQIVVLDFGRVVQQGRAGDALAAPGPLRSLFSARMGIQT